MRRYISRHEAMKMRPHTLSGRLFAGALGEDTTLTASPTQPVPMAVDSPILGVLDTRTQQIVKLLDEQNKARKLALVIAGASALFAAVKLGLVAFPHIKSRVGGG